MWRVREGVDVTSAFRGVTTPISELITEIESRGWVPDVKIQGNEYVASGKNPHGETLQGTGPTDATAASNLLIKIMRRETIRGVGAKTAQWNQDWSSNLEEIAKAYAKAPVYDPKAAPAWKALADDSTRRAETIKQQITVEVVPDPEPYDSPQEMCEDVHNKKHFYVSSANSQHPMWSVDQNVAFRIVHDVLGHCASGGDFGWEGENKACAAHFPLLTPLAQKALFTECIAQTAAGAYFRSFMQQKVAFMDDFIEQAQEAENDPNHQGQHPSQSLVPTGMPQVQPSTPQGLPWATQVPSPDFAGGLPVFGAAGAVSDPNANWTSGVEPHPNAAYVWGGDPLEAQAVTDNAMKIDTGWEKFVNPKTGELDRDSMKQAITNAFRAVLLSPRKDLRWNAVHYQDIQHIPATVTDPKRYWDALEQRRVEWNTARNFHPDSHKPYFKELQEFTQFVAAANPELDPWEAKDKAETEFMHIWMELEEGIEKDPKNEKLDAGEIERKVAAAMKKHLKAIVRPKSEDTDYGHEQMHMLGAGQQYDLKGQEAGKYGAFMGGHLKNIAQISQHSDEILDAAIADVHEHDGTGHHFRSAVLGLNLPGVGPKVCSFAWLLLQPATSQLATIDVHMMDVLGHDYAKKMNNRDYFKYERELAAGRDASGYGHVPLGQFQWGMWDHKRTGPGSHQDHSSLKVIGPTPHDQIDWAAKAAPTGEERWVAPEWWENTAPAREMVGKDWDQNVATQFNQNAIPRLSRRNDTERPTKSARKMQERPSIELLATKRHASSDRIPWILNQNTVWIGTPGETFMNLARRQLNATPQEVWLAIPEPEFSVGIYDQSEDRIFAQDRITRQQEEIVRQQLGVGTPAGPSLLQSSPQ